MKKCDVCRLEKDDEEFAWRWKQLGIRGDTCRECKKEYNKEYFKGPARERHLQQVKERKEAVREMAKEYVYQYLLTHPCSQCGESAPRVLEFHHEHSKEYSVSVMVNNGYPIKKIQAEID